MNARKALVASLVSVGTEATALSSRCCSKMATAEAQRTTLVPLSARTCVVLAGTLWDVVGISERQRERVEYRLERLLVHLGFLCGCASVSIMRCNDQAVSRRTMRAWVGSTPVDGKEPRHTPPRSAAETAASVPSESYDPNDQSTPSAMHHHHQSLVAIRSSDERLNLCTRVLDECTRSSQSAGHIAQPTQCPGDRDHERLHRQT